MVENLAIYESCHPLQNKDQARELQRIGEVRVQREVKGETLRMGPRTPLAIHPSYRFANLVFLGARGVRGAEDVRLPASDRALAIGHNPD